MERVESQQTASRTRRGGILESASRRVRMIFSVMASPNRIDILRILNSKGPLTYSELKSLAGFKSKKESGKFAYHLRKLLRQSLVSLNKAERRYTITNLGKLVLSLARQIEERSIIESGKLYVRTTKPSIEEFDSNKIIQSLVRETNMPLELAHKITEEVENKIYKIQTSYLTSSLIRETTNSVLVDHGYDDYRNKLTRLGIPSSDLVNLLHETNSSSTGIQDLLIKTSQFVFNEYLLNNSLPKDIVDMHLTGEINIGKSGFWNLLPDTVFINLDSLESAISVIKGKCLTVSRIPSTISYQNFDSVIPIVLSLLSKEVSREIILDGLLNSIQKDLDSSFNLSEKLANFFYLSSAISSYTSYSPYITLSIKIDDYDQLMITSVLDGYQKYVTNTPTPTIGLSLTYDSLGSIQAHSEKLANISRIGGIVSYTKQKVRGRYGLSKPNYASNTDTIIMLQSLSVNLPRIAYQSNKDETYFRARLALLLKPLTSIIFQRSSTISDIIQKGTIPLLTNATSNMQVGKLESTINLVGIHESVYRILGYNSGNLGDDIINKVAQTTVDIVNEQIKGNQENTGIGITMLKDESAGRFKDLNTDKYGKSLTHSNNHINYSHEFRIPANDIISNNPSVKPLINIYSSIEKILTGGVSVDLDINTISSIQETKNSIESSIQLLPFFHTTLDFYICNICGKRSYNTTINICDYCSSHKIFKSST